MTGILLHATGTWDAVSTVNCRSPATTSHYSLPYGAISRPQASRHAIIPRQHSFSGCYPCRFLSRQGSGLRAQQWQEQAAQHDVFLEEALALTAAELRPWADARRDYLTLDFLSWLADREDEAVGDSAEKLGTLGGQLMAIREGLLPLDRTALDAELAAAAAQLGSSQGEVGDGSSANGSNQNEAGVGLKRGGKGTGLSAEETASIAQWRAAMTFSREGAITAEKQVEALEVQVKEMRQESSVSLIGRQRLSPDQASAASAGFAVADAAGRIMDVLLAEPDRKFRRDMLPEAFTPPESSEPLDDSFPLGPEEMLSTSPLRLLLAIDGELSGSQRTVSDGDVPQLTGEVSGVSGEERNRRLEELRADVQEMWDSSGGSE